jgi:hypothetical protein
LRDSHTNPQSYIGNGISYFGASSILYAKISAGNIKSICLNDSHTIIAMTLEFLSDNLESPYNSTPKMMLPATQTSCLKDSHTNFQINVGIGITYF